MKRDSRFELLRIVSMGMIILSHYEIYGEPHIRCLKFLAPLGQVGVGIFVMISAFFLTEERNSKSKLLKRLLNLWCRVVFYSWMLLIIDLLTDFSPINKSSLEKSLFPIAGNNYWFVTSFFFLMFIVPLLNEFIRRANKQQFLLNLIVIIVFSSITTIIGQPFPPFGQQLNVGVMISEYLIIGYYRKYNVKFNNIVLLFTALAFYIGELIVNINNGFPSIILSAVLFIMIVQTCPSYYSSVINWIASSVFASYLITEDVLLRIPFWKYATSIVSLHNKFLEGFIITILTIFITVIIDKVYLFLFNKLIKRRLNLLAKNLTYKLSLD